MLGLIEYPLKSTVIRKNPNKFEVWTLGTVTSVGGTGASIYAFVSGEKSVKYTDPDGRDIRGALRGLAKAISGGLSIAGGISTLAALGAAEAGSLGAATPVVVLGGVAAFTMITGGFTAVGFGLGEMATELADCFSSEDMHIDSPTDIGGMIGAVVDINQGHDRSTDGAGPNEKLGSVINTVASSALGLATTPANMVTAGSEVGQLITATTTSVDTLSTLKTVADYSEQR
jgi:hypothetical protein